MSISMSLEGMGDAVADETEEVVGLLLCSADLSWGSVLDSSIGVWRCLESCRAQEMVLGMFGLGERAG